MCPIALGRREIAVMFESWLSYEQTWVGTARDLSSLLSNTSLSFPVVGISQSHKSEMPCNQFLLKT